MTTFHDVLSTCSPFPPPCLPFHRNSFCHDLEQLLARGPDRPIKGGGEGGGLVHCRSVPTLSPWPDGASGGFNDDSTALLAPPLTESPAPGPGFAPTRIEKTPTAIASPTDGRAFTTAAAGRVYLWRAAPRQPRAIVRP